MNSVEVLVELIVEAKSLNRNDSRLSFLRNEIEKDLEILEEYRKIEKELGIDLITLFKALKNGFYHIDKNKHIYKTKRTKGNGGAMSYYASYYEIIAEDAFDDQYFYKLKDYGKVWALTKKELKENGR